MSQMVVVGDKWTHTLEDLGREAYDISEVYRDIHNLYNYPPFQRLRKLLETEANSDAAGMLLQLYDSVQVMHPDMTPIEHLGIMFRTMSNKDSRLQVVMMYKDGRLISNSKKHVGLGHGNTTLGENVRESSGTDTPGVRLRCKLSKLHNCNGEGDSQR